MKIIYSLWTDPMKLNNNALGFNSLDDFFQSFILSVNVARQHYPNIHFYTDDYGVELIKPYEGQLNFTQVHNVLNDLDWLPKNWWAFPKIYVYSLQKEPFMHLDNDFYLWDKIPDEVVKNHDIICQSHEPINWDFFKFYLNGLNHFRNHLPKKMLDNHKYDQALNAGIYGAFNEKGLGMFYSMYEESLKSAKSILKDTDFINNVIKDKEFNNGIGFLWNVLLEQLYPYSYIIDNNLKDYTVLHNLNITHLISKHKQNQNYIDKVKLRVKLKKWTQK